MGIIGYLRFVTLPALTYYLNQVNIYLFTTSLYRDYRSAWLLTPTQILFSVYLRYFVSVLTLKIKGYGF